MKKYIMLSLLVISTLTLSSCRNDGAINVRENIQIDVVQRDWNGHRYNIFYSTRWGRLNVSVVHDPDCPKCKNFKKLIDISFGLFTNNLYNISVGVN